MERSELDDQVSVSRWKKMAKKSIELIVFCLVLVSTAVSLHSAS